jgi:hypothetical protein
MMDSLRATNQVFESVTESAVRLEVQLPFVHRLPCISVVKKVQRNNIQTELMHVFNPDRGAVIMDLAAFKCMLGKQLKKFSPKTQTEVPTVWGRGMQKE